MNISIAALRRRLVVVFFAAKLAALGVGPLRAQGLPSAPQGSFERSLLEARQEVRPPVIAGPSVADAAAGQLALRLGWYDALERAPGVGAADMSRRIAEGVASGLYDGVILGESHGVAEETAAGERFVRDLLASGARVGAFLREENLFPDTSALDAAKIRVRTFRNQFDPESDVKDGWKAAGRGLLVTYTGCAHTSDAVKDFFLYTLEEGKTWGYARGRKDMPTVEDAFARHGKHPIIVAMVQEETVFSKIQHLFLRDLPSGAGLRDLRDRLEAARAAWRDRVERYPARAEPIVFVSSPGRDNLFAGITPGERRPLELEAALQVLGAPDLPVWLGADPIQGVECLRGSSGGPSGPVETHFDVLVHAASGRTFRRTVAATAIP